MGAGRDRHPFRHPRFAERPDHSRQRRLVFLSGPVDCRRYGAGGGHRDRLVGSNGTGAGFCELISRTSTAKEITMNWHNNPFAQLAVRVRRGEEKGRQQMPPPPTPPIERRGGGGGDQPRAPAPPSGRGSSTTKHAPTDR